MYSLRGLAPQPTHVLSSAAAMGQMAANLTSRDEAAAMVSQVVTAPAAIATPSSERPGRATLRSRATHR
jgi:hypothetical protein